MFNKSVDSIVSVFTKAIDDLTKLETKHTEQNQATQILVDAGVSLIESRQAEIKRAQAVRAKLVALTASY